MSDPNNIILTDKTDHSILPKNKPRYSIQLPWLCSTFSSKSAAAVIDYLNQQEEDNNKTLLFWSTKSLVQPVLKNMGRTLNLYDHAMAALGIYLFLNITILFTRLRYW